MVKFQKQLEGQLVPEWKEAYLNYKQLKKDLKHIKQKEIKQQTNRQHHYMETKGNLLNMHQQNSNSFGSSLKVVRQLACYIFSLIFSHVRNIIVICHERSEESGLEENNCQAKLFGTKLETEPDKVFFARLDSQLNMINKFYKCKEEEYTSWADQLQNQMDTFLERQNAVLSHNMDELSCNNGNKAERLKVEKTSSSKIEDKPKKISGAYFNKKKLQHAKKILRAAFAEFYRGLGLLKNYSSLNLAAFGKILKKYDKITGAHTTETYLRMVEYSHFANSEKVVKLMDKVEDSFTNNFTKNNRREALAYLKPIQQSSTHSTAFFFGIFSGSSISLLVIFSLMTILERTKEISREIDYMQAAFPVLSTLVLFLLHMYMYGCNVYMWQHVRINYQFIFEFRPSTEFKFRDIMLLSLGFTSLLLGGMVIQLTLFMELSNHVDSDIVLLSMIMVFVMLICNPLNTCYKSTRFHFLRSLGHIVCSPLYKVETAEFFLADQLTSQVAALRNLGYISCYYIGKYLKTHDTSSCSENLLFRDFQYILSVLPYWWRLMQCLRRWIDERDQAHLINGGKYLSALVAVVMRLTFDRTDSQHWMTVFVISFVVATCYQLYWDIVVDWGLLQPNSVNPWLRNQLILKQKCIYFICMGVNMMLRLPWIYSLLHLQVNWFSQQVVDFIFASLEVLRRGLWNFFRLENEHLTNVGKYRAIKTIPLPFKDLETAMF